MNRQGVTLTFLGTGTSHGVPVIGCECPTCLSEDHRDKRTNSSLLVSVDGRNILIDCGKDFRYQALRQGIKRVDSVLLTHIHFDHIAGIDDLRIFSGWQGKSIPLYGKQEHTRYLKDYTFHYLFDGQAGKGGSLAKVDLVPVDRVFVTQGISFEPLSVFHGPNEIYGYRFLDCAYICDVSGIPEKTMRRLGDLEVLILDALRFEPHSTHFNLYRALEIVEALRPRRAYLTHICHDLMHRKVEKLFNDPESIYYVPCCVKLAHDGLQVAI